MTAKVRALGYAIVDSRDLDAWQRFACDLLGLMCASRTDDRLVLRMDEYTYRLDIRKADKEGVSAMGYDVGCQADLDALAADLRAAGFAVTVGSKEDAVERQVEALVRFRDPDDNFDVELYWGLRNAKERFTSTTDAKFVTRGLGFGHSFQVVTDEAKYRHLYMDILKGKSCETFNPCGPWLLTADEVADPQVLDLWLNVNGERMQTGTTADMVFGVDHLVWYISQFMVLEPGDLINTGTPPGVGMGRKPPRFLDAGDVVELGITGLGTQRQVCVPAP